MFTTIVAYAAFIIISIIFVALIYEGLRPRSETEKSLERLQAYANGYTTETDWTKIFIPFLIWFASGWFLFG